MCLKHEFTHPEVAFIVHNNYPENVKSILHVHLFLDMVCLRSEISLNTVSM